MTTPFSTFLSELKRRRVFRVAVVYAGVAFIVFQVADFAFPALHVPDWFSSAVVVLLLLGFFIAVGMAWAFDITDEGIVRTTGPKRHQPNEPYHPILGNIALAIIAVVAATFIAALLFLKTKAPPVVVLMDSPIPERVYDPETRRNQGTNADDLTDILGYLPVALHKETVSSVWHREDEILKQQPTLILIHRSCFFDRAALSDSTFMRHLYMLADNKLVAFLGYIAMGKPDTKFLVYSRGFGNESNRSRWVSEAVNRFPQLRDKIVTMTVLRGVNIATIRSPSVIKSTATFRDPDTASQVRRLVESMLNLKVATVE